MEGEVDTLSPSSQIPEADIAAALARADKYTDGYLYAMRFTGPDGDVVKVGQTTNIESRFRSHHKQAAREGLEFVEHWVSKPHLDITTTENILLVFCRERWQGMRGGDWFMGADHEAIVRYATAIPKKTWSETIRKARAAYYLSATYPVEAAAAAVGLTFEEATR